MSGGTGATGLPVTHESLAAHSAAGAHRGGAVVCMSFPEEFVVKFPPVPLGGEIRFPCQGPEMGDSTELLSWKPRLPGPQGALLEMVWNLITVFELENHC